MKTSMDEGEFQLRPKPNKVLESVELTAAGPANDGATKEKEEQQQTHGASPTAASPRAQTTHPSNHRRQTAQQQQLPQQQLPQPQQPQQPQHGVRALTFALAGNCCVMTAKFGAWACTGSGAMLSEAVHSV